MNSTQVTNEPKFKKTTIALRIVLALYGLVSGTLMLLGMANNLPNDAPAEAVTFFRAIQETNYLFQFMAIFKISCAILILIPRTAALGVIMFLPYTAHMFLWTVFLLGNVPPGLFVLAVNCFLIYSYSDRYKPMLAT